jgi:GNAT superfamily N-acetyltransferase
MTVIVKKCTVDGLLSEPTFANILAEYAKELVVEGAPAFSAKIEKYKHLEKVGCLQPFGAYAENKLVGFITVLTDVFLHLSVVMAFSESYFVLREYRSTGAGTFLRRTAEKHAKSEGASGILISAPFGGVLAEVLANTKEYTETNRVFFRSLANV